MPGEDRRDELAYDIGRLVLDAQRGAEEILAAARRTGGDGPDRLPGPEAPDPRRLLDQLDALDRHLEANRHRLVDALDDYLARAHDLPPAHDPPPAHDLPPVGAPASGAGGPASWPAPPVPLSQLVAGFPPAPARPASPPEPPAPWSAAAPAAPPPPAAPAPAPAVAPPAGGDDVPAPVAGFGPVTAADDTALLAAPATEASPAPPPEPQVGAATSWSAPSGAPVEPARVQPAGSLPVPARAQPAARSHGPVPLTSPLVLGLTGLLILLGAVLVVLNLG